MARKLVVEIVGDASSLQKTFRQAERSSDKLNKELSRSARGVAAGSGLFKSLGRSVAFASAGFLGFASVTKIVSDSLQQASEHIATERQLAAQFRASGQSLAQYRDQIEETTNRLSYLAGFEDDELQKAFITAFRGSNDVTVALKIQAIAADVARGRHIELQQATLALTKAFGGQATALRRLGVLVPANVKGMAALNYVAAKFAGQAKAGTTSQERFNAMFKNMEEIIGTALLPSLNDLLDQMSKWMANPENQKKVQHAAEDTGHAIKTAGTETKNTASEYVRWWNAAKNLNKTIEDFGRNLASDFTANMVYATKAVHDLGTEQIRLIGIMNQQPITGEDIGLRGAAARMGVGPVGATAAGGRTSFRGQMNQLELRLAQALTTVSKADDRAILILQKHLLERWVAHTKDWKLRQQLYSQLASVQDQIASIDDDQAQKEKDAKQKELDAEKKRLEAHRDHVRKMRAAWQEQLAKLREAAAGVRGEFGAMPFQQAPAGILGVPGPSAGGFVSGYAAQTRQFVNFYRDLRRLRKAGAPRGLVEQFRQAGVETAGTTVTGLLAHPRQLKRLAGLYRERERVVQQIAHADIHARIVNLHVAGSRPGATVTSQRAGRTAGARS